MNQQELEAYLAQLRQQLEELDQQEPKRMGQRAMRPGGSATRNWKIWWTRPPGPAGRDG